MKVGELFVELGITGAAGAVGALSSVKKGLSEIVTETVTAVGLVTGLIYAFGRLSEASGVIGASLQKFSNLTGQSSEMLQRWQYIFQQSNVDKEDTLKTFQELRSTLAKIDLLHPPADWLQFILSTEKIDFNKIGSMPLDQQLEVFRKFAQDERVALRDRAQMLKESGLFSDSMIQGLMTNHLDPNKDVPAWAVRTDREVKQLAGIEATWKNFYDHLGRIRDKFVEKYSGKLLGGLEKTVIPQLEELATTLVEITDALGENGLLAVGIALLAVFNPLAAAIAAIVLGLNEMRKYKPEWFSSLIHPIDTAATLGTTIGSGIQPGFGLNGDTTYNITQNITSSKPEEAGRRSVNEFKKLIHTQKQQIKAPYFSNPKKNEYGG